MCVIYWLVDLRRVVFSFNGINHDKNIDYPLQYSWASLVVQLVKNRLAIGETWVRSLGWKDPLKKGTPTHSGILAWRIP